MRSVVTSAGADTKRYWRWFLGVTLFLLPVSCMACVAMDWYRVEEMKRKAETIKTGWGMEQVVHLMGEPRDIHHSGLLGSWLGGETWTYGSALNLTDAPREDFPYFWPFREREWFTIDENDVWVVFNSEKKVQRVQIPE